MFSRSYSFGMYSSAKWKKEPAHIYVQWQFYEHLWRWMNVNEFVGGKTRF